jgi:hypothetical protein
VQALVLWVGGCAWPLPLRQSGGSEVEMKMEGRVKISDSETIAKSGKLSQTKTQKVRRAAAEYLRRDGSIGVMGMQEH